ncbi:MAG: hypothetical protein K6A23_07930 [Butyrivibrio sp.]|nr:hypothetical protein [Butyrivibrio sp.]
MKKERKEICTTLKRIVAITLTGVILCLSQNNLSMDAKAESEELEVAKSCTFVIPSEFVPSSTEGLFVDKNAPYESGTISYSVAITGEEVVLTNKERELEYEESLIEDASTQLTKDIYESQMTQAYNSKYGFDVAYSVSSFDIVEIDGFPGYKIGASYNDGKQNIYQTVYMIISRYKTFTICYTRAEDDDVSEQFDKSAKTIHVN